MLNSILNHFAPIISKALDHPKPPVVKNILMAINESIGYAHQQDIDDKILRTLLPSILSKWTSEKLFIKREAEKALDLLTRGNFGKGSLEVFSAYASDKNPNVAEIAFLAVCQIVMNLGNDLTQISNEVL